MKFGFILDMLKFFKVIKRSSKSKARLGLINTAHGQIKTPAFVPVATKGTIKSLTPSQVNEIGLQTAFVNTYHLVTHPGITLIEKAGGIHKFSRLNLPLMSDSGGFQVFSLAKSKRNPQGSTKRADVRGEEKPLLVKISENSVLFRSVYDGRLIEFTPEKSIEYQKKIGADIIMAFDECTDYPATYEYAKKAMERTHKWLKRCIIKKQTIDDRRSKIDIPQNLTSTINPLSSKNQQALYGVIQGGTYRDLRRKSAEFVTSQALDGIAIGGVSVGESKKEMREQVRWVSDFLPVDKPVHLLGVGQIDDIIDLVKYGIDTFDCVEPTRLARMGTIYKISNFNPQARGPISKTEELDITKSIFKEKLEPLDINCRCYTCRNFSKAYLHHLFKQKEILAYSLATFHNLYVMERFFAEIRALIEENKL